MQSVKATEQEVWRRRVAVGTPEGGKEERKAEEEHSKE